MRPLPFRFSRNAFSLVENVIALGIVSVSLTTILGLLPVGLNIFRESVQATVQADILRQLSSEFQETPFDQLSGVTGMLYFSDQSAPVTSDADALLGVTYQFASNTPLLSGQAGYNNSNLKMAVVRFYSRADRAKSPQEASMTNVLYVAPGVR